MSLRLVGGQPWHPHQRVLIDTNVWIYDLNKDPEFGASANEILNGMQNGSFQGIASEISLLELLVKPLKLGQQELAEQYELILISSPNLTLAPIGQDVLLLAAQMRAHYGLKTPDAIIVATGILNGATLAITNDGRWSRIAEINILLLRSSRLP